MAKSAGSAFTGGKLSLKGDKTKPKKKSTTSKPKRHGKIDESDITSASANSAGRRSHPDDSRVETNKNIHDNNSSDDEDLTAAERRSRKFKQLRERKELEQVVRCVTIYDSRCAVHHIACMIFSLLRLYDSVLSLLYLA
jgi:hypothetical protein